MADVVAALTMSLDGFIAHEDDRVDYLFDWYEAGDITVAWPGMSMFSHVDARSAKYLADTIERAGALVAGRQVFDYTNGWGGTSTWRPRILRDPPPTAGAAHPSRAVHRRARRGGRRHRASQGGRPR